MFKPMQDPATLTKDQLLEILAEKKNAWLGKTTQLTNSKRNLTPKIEPI
jgi:hypothetical protein